VYEWASVDQQGLQKYSIQLKASALKLPLVQQVFLPTLKPVPLESPPDFPPSLSHGWGVHSTSIPIDSCTLVMYSSYLSTLVLYSDGFIGPLHFLVLYSDCLFGFLYKKWFTECHFAIVPYHEMSAICKILAYIQDTGMPLNFHGIVQQYLQK